MKALILVKPMNEEDSYALSFTDYTIIYRDRKTGLIKRAIPDFHNQHIENTNIREALDSKAMAFFQNVAIDLVNQQSDPMFLVLLNGDVIEQVDNMKGSSCFSNMLNLDGKVLTKRLNLKK